MNEAAGSFYWPAFCRRNGLPPLESGARRDRRRSAWVRMTISEPAGSRLRSKRRLFETRVQFEHARRDARLRLRFLSIAGRWRLAIFAFVAVWAGAAACATFGLARNRTVPDADPFTVDAEDPPAAKTEAAPSKWASSPLQPNRPRGPAPEGMVWIHAGTFRMGDDNGQPDESPAHDVTLDGFWMDRTEVTNAQFLAFVKATAYVTLAERTPKREDFRGVVQNIADIPAANLVPGAICFNEGFDRRSPTKDDPL